MGLISDKIYYGYNDVTIVPSVISNIEHRSECNPFDENGMLPLFTAPMDTVVNEYNFNLFVQNKINAILPRTVSLTTRIRYSINGKWAAYSLNEFSDVFCLSSDKYDGHKIKALIDVANGHMAKIFNLVKAAKGIYGDNIEIMVGNIANPLTYKEYADIGVDYIRCSVGSGCFIGDTNVTLSNNTKKYIKDVQVGDKVKTINGNYNVIGKKEEKTSTLIKINNSITCTPNHKFLVINKDDREKINENNINEYSYYVEAEKLDKNKQLLVKML